MKNNIKNIYNLIYKNNNLINIIKDKDYQIVIIVIHNQKMLFLIC